MARCPRKSFVFFRGLFCVKAAIDFPDFPLLYSGMRSWVIALVVLLFSLISGGRALAQDAQVVYKKALPSIMTLKVYKRDVISTGTAFLVIKEGYAVTAWHVVKGALSAVARFSDGQEYEVIGLVDKDEKRDLALIRVRVVDRPMLTLAQKDPEVGSKAYLLGAPKGLDFSLADGIISQVRLVDGVKQYQYTTPTNPGNSGGPVLNSDAEVLGVVSYRLRETEGLNFAIASVNVRAMDTGLPTQPWNLGQVSPQPSNPVKETRATTPIQTLAEVMTSLWKFAVRMDIDTEKVMMGSNARLSVQFEEDLIRLRAVSGGLRTIDDRDWVGIFAPQVEEIIDLAMAAANQLLECSGINLNVFSEDRFDAANRKFVTVFRLTEFDETFIKAFQSEAGLDLRKALGPALSLRITAGRSQKGWKPGELDRVSRQRFEGGYRLLARLAYDIDSTGYVFGFVADVENPAKILDIRDHTPPWDWGFKKDDVVTAVEGTAVSSIEQMKTLILATDKKAATVTVDRNGKSAKVKVNLKKWL